MYKIAMEEPIRVRMPYGKELLGIITANLGASRFRVDCIDGKSRICRIPGRFRKRLKIFPGIAVLIKPWDIDNEKGDIQWIYNKTQESWLKRRGFLDKLLKA